MAIKKKPTNPRQKMINLMYVVLMAMLALNVSNEVLEGFSLVQESLQRTTDNASKQNKDIYGEFVENMKKNPEAVKEWFDKATLVKDAADELYNFAEELKVAIVKYADGPEGDIDNIQAKDDLEAAAHIMLADGTGRGKELFDKINKFRNTMLSMAADDKQREFIETALSTTLPDNDKAKSMGRIWQNYMFESMPVAAAITMLTKLQSDVRYAEGEVLHSLVSNISLKDFRANKISAFVVPNATTLQAGEAFSAQFYLAAIDTLHQPDVYINGQKVELKNNSYSFVPKGIGRQSISGTITGYDLRGKPISRDFIQYFNVVEGIQPNKAEENHNVSPIPQETSHFATLAADLMNVLYAGFDNPMSISVSGVPLSSVSLTMSGGSLSSTGNGHYIARPAAVGQPCTFTVAINGKTLGTFDFKVRKLPDPAPYIPMGGDRFKGGGLGKGAVLGASGIKAAIDDGLLDIEFRVVSFEAVFFDKMGNAVPVASAGSGFSENQRSKIRQLSYGNRFYITHVVAVGPDGITRNLKGAMEVIIR